MLTKHKTFPMLLTFVLFATILAASIACYWSIPSLFFVADDFFWIERAKYLHNDPLSIFSVEGGRYFDPLVYISFWINYKLNGLDSAWYHRTDLLIHTINAFLVTYLSLLLTKRKSAAFLSGLIFAVSPTNADSVFWISKRVDTLAAMFYLGSIISYLFYINKRRTFFYYLSLLFYAVALSAKSTPILLPIIILALDFLYTNRCIKDILLSFIPFCLIAVIYMLLFAYNASPTPFMALNSVNIKEASRAISVLFFPESVVAARETLYKILSILILIVTFSTVAIFQQSRKSSITAFLMIVIIILPLLFLNMSFVYAVPSNPIDYVVGSINHRIYLAVAGFAILFGIALSFYLEALELYGQQIRRIVVLLLAVGIFYYGYTNIKEREHVWKLYEKPFRTLVNLISSEVVGKRDNLYLLGGPGRSYTKSIIRIYTDNTGRMVKLYSKYSEIPTIDLVSHDSAVWILGYRSNIDVTRDIQEYQYLFKRCNELTGEENGRCWKQLLELINDLEGLLEESKVIK